MLPLVLAAHSNLQQAAAAADSELQLEAQPAAVSLGLGYLWLNYCLQFINLAHPIYSKGSFSILYGTDRPKAPGNLRNSSHYRR